MIRDMFGDEIYYYDDCYYSDERDEYLSLYSAMEIYKDLSISRDHKKAAKLMTEKELEHYCDLWGRDEIEPEELMEELGFEKTWYLNEEEDDYNPRYKGESIYDM